MHAAGRILVVGMRNVCRSSYIERLLAAGLADLGIDVSSAGTNALAGQGMAKETARLLQHAGIELSGFVARQLTPPMVRDADLPLTATREIRRDVVQLETTAPRYTYAIVDFSYFVEVADLDQAPTSEAPDATFVGEVAAGAATGRGEVTARASESAGITDTYGKRGSVYEAMARYMDGVVPRLLDAAHDVAVSESSRSDRRLRWARSTRNDHGAAHYCSSTGAWSADAMRPANVAVS